jgi:hypothetical protein
MAIVFYFIAVSNNGQRLIGNWTLTEFKWSCLTRRLVPGTEYQVPSTSNVIKTMIKK